MNYTEAKKTADAIRDASKRASDALRGFPKGPMGLTPDSVRATPEWKIAKAAADRAFAAERAFNTFFCKQFAAERKADRAARFAVASV